MSFFELVVTGKNNAKIELKQRPNEVKVLFKDDELCIPCNPTHFDELEWEIEEEVIKGLLKKTVKKYFLILSWDVAASRTIVVEVFY
jgi:hypothetical protein